MNLEMVKNLPVGSKIRMGKYEGVSMTWIVVEHNHPGYPDNSTTVIHETYIDKMCFDEREPNNPIEGYKDYGNTVWSFSNIKQFLNTTGYNWYKQPSDNKYDVMPGYINKIGFLSDFTIIEKSKIMTTSYSTYDNNLKGFYSSNDSVFLLSSIEMGVGGAHTGEGTKIPYFDNINNRIISSTGYFLRNQYTDNNKCLAAIEPTGASHAEFPVITQGIRPVMNIRNSTLVVKGVDEIYDISEKVAAKYLRTQADINVFAVDNSTMYYKNEKNEIVKQGVCGSGIVTSSVTTPSNYLSVCDDMVYIIAESYLTSLYSSDLKAINNYSPHGKIISLTNYNNDVYCIKETGGVFMRSTGKYLDLNIKPFGEFIYVANDTIYFNDSNNDNCLSSCDLKGDNVKKILNISVTKLMRISEQLLYRNDNDKTLYKCDLNGNNVVTMYSGMTDFTVLNNNVYTYARIGRIHIQTLDQKNGAWFYIDSYTQSDKIRLFSNNDSLFFIKGNEYFMFSFNDDYEVITKDYELRYQFSFDDNIYFRNTRNNSLLKLGSNLKFTPITNIKDVAKSIVVDNRIVYVTYTDYFIYSCKLDGSDNKLIFNDFKCDWWSWTSNGETILVHSTDTAGTQTRIATFNNMGNNKNIVNNFEHRYYFIDTDKIYFVNRGDGDYLYSCDFNGNNLNVVVKIKCTTTTDMFKRDGYLYFSDSDYYLHRLNLKTNELTKFNVRSQLSMIIMNGYKIIYGNYNDGYSLYEYNLNNKKEHKLIDLSYFNGHYPSILGNDLICYDDGSKQIIKLKNNLNNKPMRPTLNYSNVFNNPYLLDILTPTLTWSQDENISRVNIVISSNNDEILNNELEQVDDTFLMPTDTLEKNKLYEIKVRVFNGEWSDFSDINYFLTSTTVEIISKPVETSVAVKKILLNSQFNGGSLNCYTCNNAFDEVPTWEKANIKQEHEFKNANKTSDKWGISIKLILEKVVV